MNGAGTLLMAALLAWAPPLAAQLGSRFWRPDERVVLTDLSYVEAVAATEDVLYVVSREGIAAYDRLVRAWQPPVTPLDGYPADRAVAALVDPVDRSLWIATNRGLTHYQPQLRTFETIVVPGGVWQLAFDERDAFAGLYVRSGRSWEFLPRGGVVPHPARSIPPAGRRLETVRPQDLESRYPFLQTMSAFALTDDRLRRYRYTAAAEVRATNDLFLGTDGYGILRVDVLMADFERLPVGLLSGGTATVTSREGGVWAGTAEGALRPGLTFVGEDLQRYVYEEGPRIAGLGATVIHDLLERDGDLWAATDAGVLRIRPGGAVDRITTADGLASDRVFALAAAPVGVWIGTARGLAVATAASSVRQVGDALVRVDALAASGDTVWVGSRAGLGMTWTGGDRILAVSGPGDEPLLGEPIVAVAVSGDTVVVATPDRIAWRGPPGAWQVERAIAAELGELTALAVDAAGVWIGGARGIALYRYRTRDFLMYNAVGDVPGPVRDVTTDARYVWAATNGGLVRFTKDRLLP